MIGWDRRVRGHAVCVVLTFVLAGSAAAQRVVAPRPATRPTAQQIVTPDALTAVTLLTSTIIAVDQANKTGNYSVLLALGTGAFQAGNSPVGLGATFVAFRQRQIDLADVVIVSPTYQIPPTVVAPDRLRMRGSYALKRGVLGFDLIYRWDNGWRIEAISLLPPS